MNSTIWLAPEPLNHEHDLLHFHSGKPAIDNWLRNRALGNSNSGASRTFVVTDDSGRVVAYYSLSAGSVVRGEIPRTFRHGSPEPVPVMLIGRFGVDQAVQGKGIGYSMLQDALIRCSRLRAEVGFMFVMVHPIDDDAARFWIKFGFRPAPTVEPMLLLPLSELPK
ncbi:MAG: GNAT family N-acetyltransferase [Promicromonosporaceae bacterium]|nr:GNAT family N-acetyltransferase [Promicromonosporaceae bacterium]